MGIVDSCIKVMQIKWNTKYESFVSVADVPKEHLLEFDLFLVL